MLMRATIFIVFHAVLVGAAVYVHTSSPSGGAQVAAVAEH